MAVETIQWFDATAFEQIVLLAETSYILQMQYNSTHEYWALNIFTRDRVALLTGKRLLLDVDLLAGATDERLPKGRLMAVSSGETLARPKYESFLNETCFLVYASKDDLVG